MAGKQAAEPRYFKIACVMGAYDFQSITIGNDRVHSSAYITFCGANIVIPMIIFPTCRNGVHACYQHRLVPPSSPNLSTEY